MTADALQVLVDNDLIKVAPLNDNFEYLDDKINTKNSILNGAINGKLSKTGDTMTGNLNMTGQLQFAVNAGGSQSSDSIPIIIKMKNAHDLNANTYGEIRGIDEYGNGVAYIEFQQYTDGYGGFNVLGWNPNTNQHESIVRMSAKVPLMERFVPDYAHAVTVVNSSGSGSYNINWNGWVAFDLYCNQNSAQFQIYVDDVMVGATASDEGDRAAGIAMVKSGSVIWWTGSQSIIIKKVLFTGD